MAGIHVTQCLCLDPESDFKYCGSHYIKIFLIYLSKNCLRPTCDLTERHVKSALWKANTGLHTAIAQTPTQRGFRKAIWSLPTFSEF